MDHLSHSSIQSFDSCPRSWFAKYVEGKRAPAGDAAAFGNNFDQGVSHALGLKPGPRRGKEPSDKPFQPTPEIELAVQFYLAQPAAWTKAESAQEEIYIDPDQWAMLAEHYGCCSEIPVPVIGYIDLSRRMEDGVRWETVDLKTSTRAEFRAEWMVQQMLYALVKRAHRVGVHLLLRRASGTFDFAAWQHLPLKADFVWVMNYIGFFAGEIKRAEQTAKCQEDLPAKPGYWCKWCAVSGECPGTYLGNPPKVS